MRRAGARASVSLTIGVAVATSLVVAGILAGPSVLDCGKDSSAVGTCLRAKAEAAGWLPKSHKQGQIDASAAALVAPQMGTAALSPEPGTVDGGAVSITPNAANVMIAKGHAGVTAETPTAPSAPTANVSLAVTSATIVTGTGGPGGAPVADVAVSASATQLDATADLPPSTTPAETSLAPFASGLVISSVPELPPLANATIDLSASGGAMAGSGDVLQLPPLVANVGASAEAGTASVAAIPEASGQPNAAAILSPVPGTMTVRAEPMGSSSQTVVTLLPARSSAAEPGALFTIIATETPVLQVEAIAGGAVAGTPPASASALLVPHPAFDPPATAAIDRLPTVPTVDPPAVDPPPPDPPLLYHAAKAAELPILKPDPRYPNFVVLSMPRGHSSSVVTLQVK